MKAKGTTKVKQIGNTVETTATCQSSSLMTRRGTGVGGGVLETRSGACGMPCHAPKQVARSRARPEIAIGGQDVRACTYSIANLRGFSDKTGNRKKQITKQAKAPRLQAAKTRSRSHRLTVAHRELACQNGRSIGRSAYASPGARGEEGGSRMGA